MYDYKLSKTRLDEVLNKRIQCEEPKGGIPSSNIGIKDGVSYTGYLSCLTVDIKNPETAFKNLKDKDSRLIKALTGEILEIMRDHKGLLRSYQEGYEIKALYSTPDQASMAEVFRIAYRINTFMLMYNLNLEKRGYKELKAGIGIAAGKSLFLLAGDDEVYLSAAIDQSRELAHRANKKLGNKFVNAIAMDRLFRENILPVLKKDDPNYESWLAPFKFTTYTFYHCNILQEDFARYAKRYVK